jgi:hypothetical protein
LSDPPRGRVGQRIWGRRAGYVEKGWVLGEEQPTFWLRGCKPVMKAYLAAQSKFSLPSWLILMILSYLTSQLFSCPVHWSSTDKRRLPDYLSVSQYKITFILFSIYANKLTLLLNLLTKCCDQCNFSFIIRSNK